MIWRFTHTKIHRNFEGLTCCWGYGRACEWSTTVSLAWQTCNIFGWFQGNWHKMTKYYLPSYRIEINKEYFPTKNFPYFNLKLYHTKMKTDLISPFDDNNSSKEDDDWDETNPGPIPGATFDKSIHNDIALAYMLSVRKWKILFRYFTYTPKHG